SFSRVASSLLLLWCSACSLSKGDNFGAYPITYGELPGWTYDTQSDALASFKISCPILSKKARAASSGSGLEVDEYVWQSLCQDAQVIQPGDNAAARAFFERRFVPYRVTNNDKEQ